MQQRVDDFARRLWWLDQTEAMTVAQAARTAPDYDRAPPHCKRVYRDRALKAMAVFATLEQKV